MLSVSWELPVETVGLSKVNCAVRCFSMLASDNIG